MQKLKSFVAVILDNFGPVLAFYAVNRAFGLKAAIVVSTLVSIVEIGLKKYKREEISNLLKFSAAITLAFGAVDLYSTQPFLLKYESTITNLITAMFFAASLVGEKTIIQEFYEKRPDPKPMTPELAAYFKLLTGVWVLYFVLKAAAYAWMAGRFSIESGMLIRMAAGSASFYLLFFVSTLGSRHIFRALKKWRVLPSSTPAVE